MGRRARHHLAAAATLAGVALALAAAAPAGAIETNPRKAILVYAGADDPQVVAAFKRVRCSIGRSYGDKQFKAKARSNGWELDARINQFRGYRDYDVDFGGGQANFSLDPPGGGGIYSNLYEPEDHPPFGGQMTFPRNGRKFGLAFVNAFNSPMNDAVGVVGFAKCR